MCQHHRHRIASACACLVATSLQTYAAAVAIRGSDKEGRCSVPCRYHDLENAARRALSPPRPQHASGSVVSAGANTVTATLCPRADRSWSGTALTSLQGCMSVSSPMHRPVRMFGALSIDHIALTNEWAVERRAILDPRNAVCLTAGVARISALDLIRRCCLGIQGEIPPATSPDEVAAWANNTPGVGFDALPDEVRHKSGRRPLNASLDPDVQEQTTACRAAEVRAGWAGSQSRRQ